MDTKQLKRAQQEATQKASLILKSGMPFFCTVLEETQGDADVLLEALHLMNKVVKKPDGTIVRDVSNVGKLLLSANDDQLAITTYIPSELKKESGINFTAWEWMDLILHEYAGENRHFRSKSNETTASGIILNDPSKDIYVFKLKDTIINKEYEFLRGQGALPAKEQEEDETLLGDDAFGFD